MSDISAADLARELNMPVGDLLAKADALIGEVVDRDGIDAARGLTTRIRQRGETSEVVVSRRLADALRSGKGVK